MDTFQVFYKIPKFKVVVHTNGKGLWSRDCRKVSHSRAEINFYDDVCNNISFINDFESGKLKHLSYAELRVYFPKKCWDPTKHGFIYTDPNWIKEFRTNLSKIGFSVKAVKNLDYSEQGLQGDNYVSLDAGKAFLKEVSKLIAAQSNKR